MTKLGKLWTESVAYVSLATAAGVSMAGNLADTYRTRGGQVDTLDKALAIVWPLFVILAIEMFVSQRWKRTPLFQVWRWVGCLAIGGMAMTASWTHLHDLMASRGQLAIVAILGPLAIDGMAIMATGLILSTRVRGHVAMSADVRGHATDGMATAMKENLPAVGHAVTGFLATMSADIDPEMDIRTVSADTYSRGQWQDDGHAHEIEDCADAPPPVHADEHVRGHDRWADLTTPATPADMADLMSWADGQDRAHADIAEELATEAQAHLAAVTDELPRRTRTAGGPVPQEFADMVKLWDGQAPARADVVKQTANWWHVSTRTARRWLNIALGEPVSGPPSE